MGRARKMRISRNAAGKREICAKCYSIYLMFTSRPSLSPWRVRITSLMRGWRGRSTPRGESADRQSTWICRLKLGTPGRRNKDM